MEKGKKRLSGTPSHHSGGSRKHSFFDKDLMGRPSQTGRHRVSSHDLPGYEPGDEESITDFTRNELLAFKTSFARPKYANTYRMEPYRKCEAHEVRKRAEEVLKNKLQDFKYNGTNGSMICAGLTEDVLAAVKDLAYDRYKYIVQVFLVEKTGQSIHITSRWVWDVARDTWVQAQHETEESVIVALIVACYYE
ncbi:dynein light chain Tctex-type protein 2 isoform X2 [Rhineura floridana]|uniref:dynein light chain Tctex-type protein 2 isoform X2 n=1 Tax=Rhineura floridana TaxID=261503 RepID=UPI002AC800B9|nr:dynein light chain Tctex-type protein 2 isoform X2 [Rhineura floridana]